MKGCLYVQDSSVRLRDLADLRWLWFGDFAVVRASTRC